MLVASAAMLLPVATFAAPITYTYSGVGSGSLGGAAFTDAAFLVSAQADTDNIAPWVNATVQNTHTSASILLDGIGSFAFSVPTHTWVANNCCGGFGVNLGLNLLTVNSPTITYGLATILGPTLFQDATTHGQFSSIATTGGLLTITSLKNNELTFAAAVPEPSTVALVLAGLCVGAVVKRRSARAS